MQKDRQYNDVVTLGGGCFWCVEALLMQLWGIEKVVCGYAGDTEVVQVHFNAEALPYGQLLRIFLSMHNPAARHRQPQYAATYRSVILYHTDAQRTEAAAVVRRLQPDFENPILTGIEPFLSFTEAEARHQQYYLHGPSKAYCQLVIHPKLAALRQNFAPFLKNGLA